MYYVGKRSTSKEKLIIFNNHGINTLQFDLPLEIVLQKYKKSPQHMWIRIHITEIIKTAF